MGYTTLWVPGGISNRVLEDSREMLKATTNCVVATGILNIWMHDPAETAATHVELNEAFGGRFLLGLGVSHAPLINPKLPNAYQHPLRAMTEFLDGLDAAAAAVPVPERIIAALSPKMLELSVARSAGSHPYHMPVAHTAYARRQMGPDALLVPEQSVVLEADGDVAREIAREHLAGYALLPNYVNSWLRLGYTADDVQDGRVSDRLVDAIVAYGSAEEIVQRCRAQLLAGADSVCIQVLRRDRDERPFDQWQAIADALELG
jgi:probable F420-dependent oxidoreductase